MTKHSGPGRVRLEAERVITTADFSVPDPAAHPFSIASFEEEASIDIIKLGKNFIEFDLKGVAPSIANALRRAAISEIPTMAIETVFVVNNTSIIPDEVLSHRLGLIPIHADPRKFDFPSGDPTDVNTIVFELREKCQAIKGVPQSASPENKFTNSSVYSQSVKWLPQGSQEDVFSSDPIRPCLGDILLLKLRPGQEVDLELHCVKGFGKDHTKWSPVSCASYRLLPEISILSPITGESAHKFAGCFPKDVIEIKTINGAATAVVKNARKDTVSRECLRHPEFADKVLLSRVHDHFIFQMETVGYYGPTDVVRESLKILADKCYRLKLALSHF